MKKYLIYIVFIVIGIVIGKFALSGEQNTGHAHTGKDTTENTMWTCSMHPQIMQPEAGDCPICGMDLIPAEEGASGLSPNQFRMTENALALANVETTKVGTASATETSLKLTGTIEPNEKTNAIQTAHFGGRIEKLFVNFTGEEVRKGQKIALIYSPALVTTQQELLTAMRMKNSQPELYKAVRNKLKLWKLSEAQIQQLETSQKVATQFPIYASVSGVVTEKMVEEGNHVMEGGALFKVSNLNTVWASFDAYENQIGRFQKGDAIRITTNVNPNEEIPAKITFIDPVLNTKTRTVAVKVALNNRDNSLKPGMFVTGILDTDVSSENNTMSIPKSAVLWTGKRSLVYVKKENEPVFEAREVILGNANGDNYEVVSGLNSDEEIVTNGAFTVDAAAQLQGKTSMMNREEIKETETLNLDARTEKALQPSIKAYLALKDALVQSDTKVAAAKSDDFRKALETLNNSQRKKIEEQWATMHQTSKGINDKVSIEQQREHFQIVSDNMITIVKSFTSFEMPLTIQFCPMADDNNGAYWISDVQEIKNPYFGDMMLNCGSVVEKLGTRN